MKVTLAIRDALVVFLERQIDRALTSILKHPEFQALEARWAGLRQLVDSIPDEFVEDEGDDRDRIVVSLWNVSKEDLADDLRYADSFRSSALYREVYDSSFNMAGGHPFGILVGDFEFSDHPSDVALLRDIASVCESAFSTFIAAAAPAMFHIENFRQLYSLARTNVREKSESILAAQFREVAYIDWNSLRQSAQSRFIALALPRLLLRRRYDFRQFLGCRADESRNEMPTAFHERRYETSADGRLWGNPAFAVAQVILRSFASSGWLADIHGLPVVQSRAGVVPCAVREEQFLDAPGLFPSIASEVVIPDELEKDLAALGFISLCDRQPTPCTFIGGTPSIHLPEADDDLAVDISNRLSGMVNYMLCACRFAHYIKRIGHDRVGSATNIADYQRALQDFLVQYVLQDENAAAELKARQPLNDANVAVRRVPGRPGEYHCEIMLKPHYELDAVEVRLETEIIGRAAS